VCFPLQDRGTNGESFQYSGQGGEVMKSSTELSIDEQAAAWALKLAEGDLSEDERRAFDAWHDAEPAHCEAFEQARKVLRMAAAAAELANERELEKELREAERQARLKSLIVAIVAASSILVGTSAIFRHGREYAGWDFNLIGVETVSVA
jgi:ferric-dicitrate binding protein FerR (iron transport regulator)